MPVFECAGEKFGFKLLSLDWNQHIAAFLPVSHICRVTNLRGFVYLEMTTFRRLNSVCHVL